MNIYVGNLSYSANESDIRALFEQYGQVTSVNVITDKATGQGKGFCFVDMPDESAKGAIEALNGQEFQGRPLRVSEARPRTDGPRSGGGGYGGGGGGPRRGGGGGGGFRGRQGGGGGRSGGRDRNGY